MRRLTKGEEEIMQMIWQHGPCTVSQLIGNMDEPKPPHSSISTIVRTLEKKEFVDHKAYGRTHEYFALVPRDKYSKFSISHLVKGYFDGSMNNMVSFLVEENDLSIKQLTEMIEELKKKESNDQNIEQ